MQIERRKAMTIAETYHTLLNQLFRNAMVGKGLASNPAAELDISALPKPKVDHTPHLRMADLPALLRKVSACGGHADTVTARGTSALQPMHRQSSGGGAWTGFGGWRAGVQRAPGWEYLLI